MDANILMTEGRFDEAREKFSQLEPYLSPENLNVKYSQVDKEKEAALKVEEARELMEAGKKDQARQLLESVPSDSMAQREAARLLKNLRE
jgi:tetratricopeptide (TPR) repeat protein